MNTTQKLMAGIQTKNVKDDIRALARKTLSHGDECRCSDCIRFHKQVNGVKTTPAPAPTRTMLKPGLADKLSAGLKARKVEDQSGQRPNPSGTTVHDDEKKKKKRKSISEALVGSLRS